MDLNKASKVITLTLLLTTISFNIIPAFVKPQPPISTRYITQASPATTFSVVPSSVTGVDPGNSFLVDVYGYDLVDVFSWQVYMEWDQAVLNATDIVIAGWLGSLPSKRINNNVDPSFLFAGETLTSGMECQDAEEALLCTITFLVETSGETVLDISGGDLQLTYYKSCIDYPEKHIPITENGYFRSSPMVQYNLTIAVNGSGTTDPAPGVYTYDEGSVVPVTAIPDDDWMLYCWLLDGVDVGSENPYTVTMDNDHALTAFFVEEAVVEYTLTIAVDGMGTTDPAPGAYTYDEGSLVDVFAIPDADWWLSHWLLDGVEVDNYNPYSVTMDADHALTAVFSNIVVPTYELTIAVEGSGTTDPVPGVYTFDEGTEIDVTAIADAGWGFDQWLLDGVDVGDANPYSVTMDADHALTARFFEVVTFDLTIAVNGSGTTDPAPGVHTYDEGTDVDVIATPDGGWMFDRWLLDGVDVGDANPYSVTMDADHALIAVFTEGGVPPIMSTFSVEPPNSTGGVGDPVPLAVNVYDAEDLYSWQIYMTWDPTVLGFTALTFGDFLAGQPEGSFQTGQLDYVSDGWLICGEATLGAYPGVTADSGWLVSVDFEVLASGETTIDIDSEYTLWIDSALEVYGDDPGEMIKENGYFVSFGGELPVASFTFSPLSPAVGENVTFDASASYDPDGTIVSYEWGFGDGSTDTGMVVTHTYEVGGNYVVTLTVADDDGLIDIAMATINVMGVHDIAVTDVSVYPATVTAGGVVEITVTVRNEGSDPETFTLRVYYDSVIISSLTVFGLGQGETRTLSFGWSTVTVTPGVYTIKAMASVVPGETHIEDNTFIDGTVTITPPPTPQITISPDSGRVGTKVVVDGSDFPPQAGLYLMFDDQLIGIMIAADLDGSFTATFNVPPSEPGEHTVKVWTTYYYPSDYYQAEATFTVIDTTPLDVDADVGAIYFKGETAEFHVQTSFKGTPVDATSIHATLYKPDDTTEILTAQRTATGLYKIEYPIKGKGSMLGAYTLVIEANYSSTKVNATGTSLKTFLVKSPWREWEHEAPKVALSVATIAAAFASVVLWRRENQKPKL
jgi:PKD repeat protein